MAKKKQESSGSEYAFAWLDFPMNDNEGNLEIYPDILDGRYPKVTILGDPEGLRYLADIIRRIADIDQSTNHPYDNRFHIHLRPDSAALGNYSCEVEICRADDKDTGEFPDFMRRREKKKSRKKKV